MPEYVTPDWIQELARKMLENCSYKKFYGDSQSIANFLKNVAENTDVAVDLHKAVKKYWEEEYDHLRIKVTESMDLGELCFELERLARERKQPPTLADVAQITQLTVRQVENRIKPLLLGEGWEFKKGRPEMFREKLILL